MRRLPLLLSLSPVLSLLLTSCSPTPTHQVAPRTTTAPPIVTAPVAVAMCGAEERAAPPVHAQAPRRVKIGTCR